MSLRGGRLVSCVLSATFLVAWVAAAARAQSRGEKPELLTVERIYTEPNLNGDLTPGIKWSPDSRRISYLAADRAGLEIWTMDAASGERKVLVPADVLRKVLAPNSPEAIQSTGLGRVQADKYMWSPSGDALLFPGCGRIMYLDLNTMTPRTFASESDVAASCIEDAKFSPDGKWISFVRDANLWLANVASGEVRRLTAGSSEQILNGQLDWLYPEELGNATAYWWSPDSSKIAYYEMDERRVTHYPIMDMSSPVGTMEYTPYPQAGEPNPVVRVGVISIEGGETKWMDTGADKDIYSARVEWLRDSRRVAVERLNRAENHLDLLFCDAETGASATVLAETDPYWINIADDLYFFSDNKRFLWSSERSGFRHYYLYDLSGRLIQQLTSGDWQISGSAGFGPGMASHPAIDEAHGLIYFLSNKDDARETQLNRLSLRDQSLTRITREPGTHDILFAPDASAFVDTHATTAAPPRQDLDRADGSRIAAINEDEVPQLAAFHLSPVEFLTLPATDGTKLYAKMIKPPDFQASHKYPVLIFVWAVRRIRKCETTGAATISSGTK